MLRSVLLSPDENAARIIGRVFKDLEVAFDHTVDPAIVLSNDRQHRYDAIVIDDSIQDAVSVLEKILALSHCNKSVRIVLADPANAPNEVFKKGAQVIFYKPISAERVRHGLRAVRNLMGYNRRRGAKRISTMLPARVRCGRSSGGKVLIADLSESGAALHCADAGLIAYGNLHIDFALPEEAERIHVTAELIWQNNAGAAGVRFLDMASSARKRLAQWVKEQSALTEKGGIAAATRAGI